eukprot:PITA_16882
MGKPTSRDEMPLQPQVALEPFDNWGMDLIGPIDPPSGKRKYIIVCIDYLTKVVVTDQGEHFTSNLIEDLLRKHHIKNKASTTYNPQENGQVEVINKALESILTKFVNNSGKDWVERLVEAIWAYNTTWKTTTRFTPYDLVYGKKDLLSIEFEYNTLIMEV